MAKNFYVLKNNIVKTDIKESEQDDVTYSYVEPTVYELSDNRLIIANDLNGQWELIKHVGNHYISERVSHNLKEINQYL